MHYWIGRAVGDGDVGGYEPNAEIDEVAWFPIDKARRRLTYEFDIDTLDEALGHAQKTRTLIILRHSQARSRKAWRSDDRERPLLATGRHQAERLVPLLTAYDVRRLVSSSSTPVRPDPRAVRRRERAQAAHRPSAQRGGRHPEGDPRAADPGGERPPRAAGLGRAAWSSARTGRCCRLVFEAVGLDDPGLAPGELVVLHLREGPDPGGRSGTGSAESAPSRRLDAPSFT